MTPRMVFLDLRGKRPRRISPPAETVLCLGNFDGVHRAHRALLREGIRLAAGLPAAGGDRILCGGFCFFRPSGDYFGAPPAHLTTLRQKLALMAAAGVDVACLCAFPDVQKMPPAVFMSFLQRTCGCVGVACGYNFRFGLGACGTPADLSAYFGCERTVILPEMHAEGGTVSATRIRDCLQAGDPETAARLLGRPYAVETTVTHGKRLGRVLGFPTANQPFLAESLIPAHGVYAALCHTPNGVFPGVANVGSHPTVDTHAAINCETHILGYTGDLYGIRLKVELLAYLRPETRFADTDALADAIRRDAARAEAYIREWRTKTDQ